METLKEEIINLESNDGYWTIRYALLAEPVGSSTRFGVSAFNETTGEQMEVHDVLLHQQDGEELLSRLAAGGVTPVTLRDVVEDFIAENG